MAYGFLTFPMIGLLTWPAYGTWFARPHRGWIDRDRDTIGRSLPEPTRRACGVGEPLKWPPVLLTDRQQRLIIKDLGRIAALRGFELHMICVSPDHVHVLLSIEAERDIPRLVQLAKGSLSRTLTVDAGDQPATSTGGGALVHHKWWSRQYSFRRIQDTETLDRVTALLRGHGGTLWVGEENRRAGPNQVLG